MPEAWLAVWASGLAVCASGLTGWAPVLDCPEGGWTDKQMDGKSPYSTEVGPLLGPLPKKGGFGGGK